MGDASRKGRSAKKTKNSISCLLLRRNRRRASSEPPKGKRFDREKACSARTLKPRKIPRDEGYSEARNSESDSGFLSFESIGSKRSNVSSLSMNQYSGNFDNVEKENDERLQSGYFVGNDTPPLLERPDDDRGFDQPDIVDLNYNLDNSFVQEQQYDSDGVSIRSNGECVRCFCLPRIFKSHNSRRNNTKRGSSATSYSEKLDDSVFDLRGSSLLRTISDLRSSIAEGSRSEEEQCFLKLVYNEHRCVDPSFCKKAKFTTLNAHLRTLVDCMPQTYCECESKRTWTNYILDEIGYVPHRRNAVCETEDRTRETVCKAFCSFMTLKALLRYDLL